METKVNAVINRQRGVMRVNCFDCIDRTSILQSKVGFVKFWEILDHLDISLD